MLQKLVSAEFLGSFAITEPQAGSDVMAIKSFAEDKGDHWLINGTKTWISNATLGDVTIFYAYTDTAGKKVLSAFVVELKNFNGITVTDLDKLGSRSSPTGEIILEDTKVPKENILGKPGDGAKIVFSSLAQTRLSAAAGGIGWPRPAWTCVTKYAMEREQFGKPIGAFQMNQDMIGQMVAEIEAGRLMVYKAAWQKDQGNLGNNLEVAAGEIPGRRTGLQVLAVCDADTRGIRLFHRIPRGPLFPGCTYLCHGRGIRKHLQIYNGPGSAGDKEGKQVNSTILPSNLPPSRVFRKRTMRWRRGMKSTMNERANSPDAMERGL